MSKKSEKENKKKKKGHPVRNTLFGMLLMALLGGGAWRFGGFPWGYQGNDGDNKETTAEVTAEATTVADTTVEVTDTETAVDTTAVKEKITVVISEDKIAVDGESCDTTDAMKEKIMAAYSEGMTIELVDDKAVKGTYDSAKAVLDDLGYNYTIATEE